MNRRAPVPRRPPLARIRSLVQALFVLTALILAGCGDSTDPRAGWQGTIRDSAGVILVENPSEGLWAPGEAWRFDQTLRIGVVTGEPVYQFGRIRAMDVDGAGNIYVLDAQTQNIRVFSPAGEHVRTIGGPGGGPGELSQMALDVFVMPDGGLVVPDFGNRRVARYSAAGEPTGSTPLSLDAGLPTRWHQGRNGRLVVQIRSIPGMGGGDSHASEPSGDPLVVFTPGDSAAPDTLLRLPPRQSVQYESGGGPSITLFAPEPVWELDSAGTLVTGTTGAYRFTVRELGGDTVRVITKPFKLRTISADTKEEIKQRMIAMMKEDDIPPRAFEMLKDGLSIADRYPVFASIMLGPRNTLWVQHVKPLESLGTKESGDTSLRSMDLSASSWDVFDARGRFLGTVEMPERFNPMVWHDGQLYGVSKDELGVSYVSRLRLITEPTTPDAG